MTKREIVLDDESARILEKLAKGRDGDVNALVRDLLCAAVSSSREDPGDALWNRLALEEFARGCSSGDAVYDRI